MASTKPKRVICISTGQVYGSIRDAARAYDQHPSTVMRSISSGRPCAGKYWMHLPENLDGDALDRWRMLQLLRMAGYEIKEE